MSKKSCNFVRSYNSTEFLCRDIRYDPEHIRSDYTAYFGLYVLGSGVVACKCGLIGR